MCHYSITNVNTLQIKEKPLKYHAEKCTKISISTFYIIYYNEKHLK